MDWERVNVWTNTLYTLIHSLHMADQKRVSWVKERQDTFGQTNLAARPTVFLD